jgi:hypothetical protein
MDLIIKLQGITVDLQMKKKYIHTHINTQETQFWKKYIYTVEPRFTNAPAHEQIFPAKTPRMTNGVSDYEHASWQQRQAESIGAGVSVAG